MPFNVIDDNIDLASISAHKIYGPKGVGALYVRRRNPRVQLVPQMDGGGHERGMRSGTLNVPGIVGMGKACELAGAEMAEERKRLFALRESLREQIFSQLDEVFINGSMEHRLPGSLNISFAYVEGESPADGYQRHCGKQRLGLYLRNAGAELRAEGAGRGRRAGAQFDSLWAGAL